MPNLQGSCRNTSRWCLQNYIENDSELTSELTSKWIAFKNIQSIFTLSSLITFEVLNQTLPNLQGNCRNTSRWCLQNYMENDWELTSKLTSKWITFKNIQSIFTLNSSITFEVLNQTLPNLQGNCRNTRWWFLQNYMENGWELTSESTSKWITFKNIQLIFTLSSLITFEVLDQTLPNLQGSCRNTSRWCLQNYMENDSELTSKLTSKWITFKNIQLIFTLSSLITFEVLNQTLPNLQGSCRNTSRWCLQNYMDHGWELASELTSKWITFKNIQSIFTLISLITFEVLNQTLPNLQGSCRNTSRWCLQKYIEKRLRIDMWYDVQMNDFLKYSIIFYTNLINNFEELNQTLPNLQGSCRNTSRWCLQNYMENDLELTSELTSKWITFKNIQSIFTLSSLITFEVLNQTLQNLQGNCRNTSRWCLQKYMENDSELTSELTSKWITFKNIQSILTLSSIITFEVLNQTLPNLQGSCRNTSRWCLQNYMENDSELTSELTSKWITFKNIPAIFTLSSLITFEVLNQTLPNLQGNCRNTSRWCLQNYMENDWELTSKLTSKWITFKNIQSIFTLNSSITFEVLNQTLPNLQGNCRNTRWWFLQNYMENGWELTSESTSKWITFKNIQLIFTLSSLITFEVLDQTLPNLQGSCRNTSRWCLQNYMENDSELTSKLTSKWITFKNIQLIFTLSSLITFEVLNQTLPNLQGSCRNTSRWCLQNYMDHGWELASELTSKWITFKNIQSIFTLISLITFEVLNQTLPNLQGSCRNTSRWCLQKYIEKRLRIDMWYDVQMNDFLKYSIIFYTNLINNFEELNQTLPNLQGSCRNTSRWCLQNYMENDLELTSELTSKWITFKNIQSIFTLSSLITFEVLNQTLQNLQGNCRNTSRWCLQKYMENDSELTSELTSKWITFKNIQSILTLSSIITFEVLNQTLPNLQGNCRNTSRWCLQNYMGNDWELTSELTSKWITFKNIQLIFTLSSLITFEVLNQTLPNLQWSCRNISRWCLQNYMEHGWELTSDMTFQWITF